MNIFSLSTFIIMILTSQYSYAELIIPGLHIQSLNTLVTQDPILAKTGVTNNQEDITSDQDLNKIVLNEQQLHEAKVWELTPDEEKRYVLLMRNRSGLYYKGLRQTPLDILGLNARTDEERTHFAEIAAKQEAQKVSKNIAWNNAFSKAYNTLFLNVPIVGDFDPSPYSPYAHQPIKLAQGDVLFLFIKPDEAVKSIVMTLIEAIEDNPATQLHFMLLKSDDQSIQLWANRHQIPQHLITKGRLSINHGEQNYQSLTIGKKHTPLLLLSHQGQSNIVDLGRF